MKEKRKYLLAVAVGVLCLVAGFLFGARHLFWGYPVTDGSGYEYGHVTVDEQGKPYFKDSMTFDVENTLGTEAAFLLDPYLELTADQAATVLTCYFTAPTLIYFSAAKENRAADATIGAAEITTYKLRDPQGFAALAALFADVDLEVTPIPAGDSGGDIAADIDSDNSFIFQGALGHVYIAAAGQQTYIQFRPDRGYTQKETEYMWAHYPVAYDLLMDGNIVPEVEKCFDRLRKKGEKVSDEEYMIFE